MSDHVSQETAARLKAAGWEGETEFVWISPDAEWLLCWKDVFGGEAITEAGGGMWLPAPSIGELGERLTYKDFHHYYEKAEHHSIALDFFGFPRWLCDVHKSADALALIWLWAHGKEGE